MGGRTPIILDVDTGIDDAVALALAITSPEVELVAVSTVAGNVDLGRATDNTLRVLSWLGGDRVPVHRGATHPLVRPHVDAAFVHGTNGLGGALFPDAKRGIGPDRGPAAIIRLAKERPGEITLVCTGPLTNLAIALNVEPALPFLPRRLVIMGGAYRVPGNITPDAEYNIYVDPEAAAQVFGTRWPSAVAIGLDVTHRTKLSKEVWEAAQNSTSRVARLVVEVARRTFVERESASFYLHDPLALAVGFDPTLVSVERADVTVDIGPERLGKTTIVPLAHGIEVPVDVDADRFVALCAERLGLSARA